MRAVALCAVLALGTVWCRPKPKPQAEEPAHPVATADVGGPIKPTSARACIDDRGCKEYLRCERGACVVPPAVDGRIAPDTPIATFHKDGEQVAKVYLELAVAVHERTRGLMHRPKMASDWGMLFVFDHDKLQSFWMRNTLIPLDMIHIDDTATVVGIVENAEPLTETPRRTTKPARYVLEVVGGGAAALGITEGSTMVLEGVPQAYQPRNPTAPKAVP